MTTAERPLRADARRNHEKLVAAAREAFTAHGVETPLDEIARRAGVGPGTLYRHFPTREALLAAVYREDVQTMAAQAADLGERLPPLEALTEWLRLQLDYVKYKYGLGSAIKSMLGNDSDTLNWCRQTMRAAADQVLTRAQEDGSIRGDVDPTTMLRLVHAVGVASESAPDQADLLLSVVLAGLRTAPGR